MAGILFLSPLLKKSSSIDFSSDFNKFIRNSYDEDPAKFKDAIKDFNQLRDASCVQVPDKHEASLDVLLRYFDQLNVVDTKLPISESQIRIRFSWQDSFNVGGFLSGAKKHAAVDIAFERCCLLFNIGALQCQIAKSQNFDSDEGLKLACKHFQGAAGTFTRLRDDVYQHLSVAPTPDLGAESTTAMCNIMLAQAQEAFFLKASKDKMQEKVIAKLAHQASDLYADTLSSFQQSSVRSQWEKEWIPVVSSKQSLFLALAEESQAKVCLESQSYGESIARLKQATSCLEDALKRGEGFYDAKPLLARVRTKLEKELKDNKLIYSDPVPEYATIEPVGKAALAKPLPFNAPQGNFVDLFYQLMPYKVNEALQIYEQRKQGLIGAEIGRLRTNTQELTSLMTSCNLPAAFEDTSGTGAPPSVLEKAAEVRNKGGIVRLNEMISNLPELLVRNKEILDETARVLNEEDREDGECRAKYGDKWSRMPSAQLTVNVRADISKYQGILTGATSADKVVNSKYQSNREAISLLSEDQASLVASIPTSGAASRSGSSGQVVQHLKQLCEQVDTLKAERDAIESSLKDNLPSPSSKFLDCLKSEGSVDEETISMTHLQDTYSSLQQQVQDSISRGAKLVEQIKQTNAQFVNECQQGEGAAERERVLKNLQSGYEAFSDLIGNLEEGSKFYGDLTNLLLKCQQKVGDLTFARRTEKDDLCKDLDKVLATSKKGSGQPTAYVPQGATTAPPPQQVPPRPAPPPQQFPPRSAPPPQQVPPPALSAVMPPAPAPYYPGYPAYGAPPPGYPYAPPPGGAPLPQQTQMPLPPNPAGAQPFPYYPAYGYGYPPYGYPPPPQQ